MSAFGGKADIARHTEIWPLPISFPYRGPLFTVNARFISVPGQFPDQYASDSARRRPAVRLNGPDRRPQRCSALGHGNQTPTDKHPHQALAVEAGVRFGSVTAKQVVGVPAQRVRLLAPLP